MTEWIVTSSVLILLVLLIRFAFRKKISLRVRYALWAVVAIRLLVPFSISGTHISVLNLLPEEKPKTQDQTLPWQAQYGVEAGTGIIRPEQELEGEPGFQDYDTDPKMLSEQGNTIPDISGTRYLGTEPSSAGYSGTEPSSAGYSGMEPSSAGYSDIESLAAGPLGTELPSDDGDEPVPERSGSVSDGIGMGVLLRCLWLFGAGLLGVEIFTVNLSYGRRLKRGRKPLERELLPVESLLPVYNAEMIKSPCMFGLVHPAIYVMKAAIKDEKILRYVLCHENTHYRHRDNWWALVRTICVCIHWFNPLVWLAFYLSKQDGELACDEETLKGLDEKERTSYGRTLLDLSVQDSGWAGGLQLSTTMSGGKKQLKERLRMIVEQPGRTVGALVLVLLLVALGLMITFTGRSIQRGGEVLAAEVGAEDVEHGNEVDGAGNSQADVVDGAENSQAGEADGGKDTLLWGFGNYTGYMDECEQWAYSGEFVDLDLDCDGLTDRVWRENLEDWALADYRIEFGNGVVTEIPGMGAGIPRIQAPDLNFDGHNDLCIGNRYNGGANIPYYCMLWNSEEQQYVYDTMLFNVEVDPENQWLSCGYRELDGRYSTTYYRYDGEDRLHMIRYVEENPSSDAVFEKLDLTYVYDEESPYDLPAVDNWDYGIYGGGLQKTMILMAKQALEELYEWTGDKIDTACFCVSNANTVWFSMTPEDMKHSRTFYNRSYGAESQYNLDGYEKSISTMNCASGREVWYSPMLWRNFPENMNSMTDEEIILWYFERAPLADGRMAVRIEKQYEDTWEIQTGDGSWFEVNYDVRLQEVFGLLGPYDSYPTH